MTKLEIGICDDHPPMMDQLGIYVNGYLRTNHLDYQLHKFSTPSDVYAYMQHEVLHILFMDLEFGIKEEDGILWIQRIHEVFPDTLVLILTAYEERYKEGYRARAYRFMTKPLIRQEFAENMDDCISEIEGLHAVWIRQKNIRLRLPVKEIRYIRADMGESTIYTGERSYYSDESLLQWEQKLQGDHFFRIHKSYLVNLGQIREVIPSRHEILLGEEVRLPVARRKWTQFQSFYMRYDVSKV